MNLYKNWWDVNREVGGAREIKERGKGEVVHDIQRGEEERGLIG